jgi:putative flippase GtrA
MKKLKKRHIKEAKRFTQYMVGGGAQFWGGYLAFAGLDLIGHIPFWPNKIIAYFVGASINFFIERFWVFGSKRLGKKQLETSAERFYSLMIVNFILDLIIVGGLRSLGLTPYLGQFVSAGFFTVWNYLLFKLWVFQKNRNRKKRYA